MKRVVLIGAGHAHLVVLRSLAEKPLYNARIALVSPHAKQVYSGMLPGILAGHYRRAEAEVDIAALAERGQAEFVPGKVQRLDPDKKTGHSRKRRGLATTLLRSTPARSLARRFPVPSVRCRSSPTKSFCRGSASPSASRSWVPARRAPRSRWQCAIAARR